MKRLEETHQVTLVGWFRLQHPHQKQLLTIVSFGENVGPRRMDRLKKMGLTKGWPDLLLAKSCHDFHGLFIEMKSPTGRLETSQKVVHDALRAEGYQVSVCYHWLEARDAIQDYLAPSPLQSKKKTPLEP